MFSAFVVIALAQAAFGAVLPSAGRSSINEVSVKNSQSFAVNQQPSLVQSLPSYSQSSLRSTLPSVSSQSVQAASGPQRSLNVISQPSVAFQSPALGLQSSSVSIQSQPAYGYQSAAFGVQTPQQASVSVIPSAPTTVQLTNNQLNNGVLLSSNNGGGQGGLGQGQVEVLGDLPLAGNANVLGSLPIQGLVGFGGTIPAGGVINIYGSVPCTC